MPILVRGNKELHAQGVMQSIVAPRRCDGCAGFTLLEMLVVLVIAGVLIATATLTMSSHERRDVQDEGERLALLFEAASDEAQLRAHPLAWEMGHGGYRFVEFIGQQWVPASGDILRARNWSGSVSSAQIAVAGTTLPVDRIIFGRESVDLPIVVTLSSENSVVHVVALGAGRYAVQ